MINMMRDVSFPVCVAKMTIQDTMMIRSCGTRLVKTCEVKHENRYVYPYDT